MTPLQADAPQTILDLLFPPGEDGSVAVAPDLLPPGASEDLNRALANIPAALRWISNFVWGRYYIEIVRDALLQGGGWPATGWKVAVKRCQCSRFARSFRQFDSLRASLPK